MSHAKVAGKFTHAPKRINESLYSRNEIKLDRGIRFLRRKAFNLLTQWIFI